MQAATRFSDPASRLSHFAEFYHHDAIFHGYASDGALDFTAAQKFYAHLWSAFPDFDVQIVRAIEDKPLIAFHYTWSGTHRGLFAGIPATGRAIRAEGMSFIRSQGSQVIERWNVSDSAI